MLFEITLVIGLLAFALLMSLLFYFLAETTEQKQTIVTTDAVWPGKNHR